MPSCMSGVEGLHGVLHRDGFAVLEQFLSASELEVLQNVSPDCHITHQSGTQTLTSACVTL